MLADVSFQWRKTILYRKLAENAAFFLSALLFLSVCENEELNKYMLELLFFIASLK